MTLACNSYDPESQYNVILRTIAGFLNSKGGVLYIGVNDKGEIIGLENDFEKLEANEDKFERIIRQKIVEYFSKDINGTIEINFRKNIDDQIYCEIVIHEYIMPVAYRDEFWQRQGNETRILKGQDIVMFIKRKFTIGKDAQPMNRQKNESQRIEIEPNLMSGRINNYSDLKSSNQNAQAIVERNNSQTLAYWNLLIDGNYIVSDTQLNHPALRISLPITENDRLKGFLLQCYDNGCVNKISVRTILNKNRGYQYSNGIFNGANLILSCIINNEMLLAIYSDKGSDKFLKLYSTENISTHSNLNLKGNQIISSDFDSLSFKLLGLEHVSFLDKLVYISPQPIGILVTKERYQKEIEFVNQHIL